MRHRRAILLIMLAAACPAAGHAGPGGTVMASDALAAQAGQRVLEAGGSATDAAIAAQMMLSVVAPQESGLGGGGILLHLDGPSRTVTSWNGREAAPAGEPDTPAGAAGAAWPPQGGRAVGVPALAAMLEAAHKQHGRLPWATLLAPAIQAAETGVPVSAELAGAIGSHADALRQHPAARAVFFDASGAPLAAGATMVNAELAQTLRAVAANGAAALMRGPIAADIATTVRAAPDAGLLTTDDLAAYVPRVSAALCQPYRGGKVCAAGAPSGGPDLLRALRLLASGDPPLPDQPHPQDATAPPMAGVAVIDARGDAVSLASSLGGPFGAGLLVRGLVLNRALAEFGPDAIRPGIQPPTPLSPVLLLDGDGRLFAAIAGQASAAPQGPLVHAVAGLLDGPVLVPEPPIAAGRPGSVPVIARPDEVSATKTQDALVNAH